MEQVQLQVSSQPQQQDTQAPATITQAPLNLQQPQEAVSQQQNDQYEAFKLFLSTAPVNWSANESIRRFNLPDGTSVSCVLWNELFHITGTDIVKALTYRFECLGRTITLQKKFEEGIFSDLRNLKPMSDSTLEESRSPFLKFLYENQCIRTQKKQKVFYWFSVNHDKLFLDALERDLKRENVGQQPCTVSRVPISMIKSMEMAKAQCMQKMAGNHSMKKYPVSAPQPISNDHPTPRISSVSHSASSGHHQYAPILNYSHPMDHLPQRSYSPFQPAANHHSHVLHPGSPPQGLLTPPLMHQQYNGASLQIHPMEHDTYRIHRTDSPLGIHRTDSPLGIHRTDSPSHSLLSYQDVASPHMHSYDGAHVLSSMFNPHEFSAPSHYGNNSNTRYSPYQNTMQAPVAIRRPASAGPSHSPQMMQHMDVSSSEKMFECPQPGCHRQFKRQEHCKRHFRSHTGEKPYTCLVPECRRSFSRQDHLQQHMRSHSETGFRLDDNILQNLVHSPQSDFSFPHQSPSVSTYGSIDYHPMRSDSRLSMHSSFEPLMSIPASASTPSVAPAPAPKSSAPGVESTEADDAATKAAVLAVEQVAAASQQDSIPTAAESTETSGKVREEYAQNMEYAMQNLLSIEPEMKFDSYQ